MKPFKKLVNFRDLGGLETQDGKRIQEKRILRSGELVALPEEEKEQLVDYYLLKTIIDFRSTKEVEINPDSALPGTSFYHIDIMQGMREKTSQESFEKNMQQSQPDMVMKQMYRQIILDSTATAGYRQFITILLSQERGAIIFHCFAGKDRTGIGAAIILTLLGVSKETIFEDYLKTNVARKQENERLIELEREKGADDAEIERFRTFISVKADYLEYAYQVAAEKYGSFANYIKKGIGVTEAEQKRLKQLYLQ